MQTPPGIASSRRQSQGFSLIELVAVVAIMLTLLALLTPAISSIGKAGRLAADGNRLDLLIGVARQNSLSRNALTTLVMNDDPTSTACLRSFSLWELRLREDGNVPTGWTQISPWEVLSEGVIVYEPQETSWKNPGSLSTPFPPMLNGGKKIESYQYRIFQPAGGLWGADPVNVKLVEGTVGPNSDLHLTRSRDGLPLNIYDITILPANGKTKISRD